MNVLSHPLVLFISQKNFNDRQAISKAKFKYLQIFQIWFVLQRYKGFAYKPFFVNMEARIAITGVNNAV